MDEWMDDRYIWMDDWMSVWMDKIMSGGMDG